MSRPALTLDGILQAIAGLVIPLLAVHRAVPDVVCLQEDLHQSHDLDDGHRLRVDDRVDRRGAGRCAGARRTKKSLVADHAGGPDSLPGRTCTPSTAWNVTATMARSRPSTAWKGWKARTSAPINGKDVLYTLNDASMAEVIAYGRPEAGMNPFGKAYNPEGSQQERDRLHGHLHALQVG